MQPYMSGFGSQTCTVRVQCAVYISLLSWIGFYVEIQIIFGTMYTVRVKYVKLSGINEKVSTVRKVYLCLKGEYTLEFRVPIG